MALKVSPFIFTDEYKSQIQHLMICSELLKFWICDHEFRGGGSLYCNENGQTVRQVKERRRHPNGKLQLEWASNRPPLSEFGITDSEFEDLSSTSQILNLWSRIQWRGFIYYLSFLQMNTSHRYSIWWSVQSFSNSESVITNSGGGGPYTVMKMGKQ